MSWDELRAAAAAELTAWTPPDPAQLTLRDEYLAHLAQHPDAHRKSGPPQHLTASCVVLDPCGSRVLLTHHRKAHEWFQFGGHLEQDDASLRKAAWREATEESGVVGLELVGGILELDRHDLAGAFGSCQQHWDVRYLATAPPDALPNASEESLAVAWWPTSSLPNPRLARLVARGQARLRQRRG